MPRCWASRIVWRSNSLFDWMMVEFGFVQVIAEPDQSQIVRNAEPHGFGDPYGIQGSTVGSGHQRRGAVATLQQGRHRLRRAADHSVRGHGKAGLSHGDAEAPQAILHVWGRIFFAKIGDMCVAQTDQVPCGHVHSLFVGAHHGRAGDIRQVGIHKDQRDALADQPSVVVAGRPQVFGDHDQPIHAALEKCLNLMVLFFCSPDPTDRQMIAVTFGFRSRPVKRGNVGCMWIRWHVRRRLNRLSRHFFAAAATAGSPCKCAGFTGFRGAPSTRQPRGSVRAGWGAHRRQTTGRDVPAGAAACTNRPAPATSRHGLRRVSGRRSR